MLRSSHWRTLGRQNLTRQRHQCFETQRMHSMLHASCFQQKGDENFYTGDQKMTQTTYVWVMKRSSGGIPCD